MTWRPARPDEDETVVAMCLALNREDPGTRPVEASQVRRTLAALRADPVRGRAVVLEEDGAARGYALLVSFWSNELGGEVCNVDELWVAPEARGRGQAHALISALQAGTGPWPRVPVAIELEVSPENARARALYEKLGFAPQRNAGMRWRG
ncbi:MAG: GNAT family N-acetyltransferase [Anaeromyxobacteraceae bacterium]